MRAAAIDSKAIRKRVYAEHSAHIGGAAAQATLALSSTASTFLAAPKPMFT